MTVPEIVAQPVEAIQRLYQQAGCPHTDGDWGAAAHFEAATAALRPGELPCLNVQSTERIPHHSLVSFYGMVQDTLNPEYYVGAFRRPNGQLVATKYSDPDMREVDEADGSDPPVVWERRPIVLVPVPGLSKWASTFISGRPGADAIGAAPCGSEPAIGQAEGGSAELLSAQLQAQAVRSQRPKRERSSDADLTLPDASTDAERGAPAPTVGGPAAGPLSQHSPGQLEEEGSMQDTDLTVDQGIPGSGTTGDVAPGVNSTDEDAARPRTRRREDSGRGAQGPAGDDDRTAEGGAAEDGAGGGAAGAAADAGREGAALEGGAAAGVAAAGAAAAAPGSRPAGEVPGSCIAYLYDNSISPLLHEVVHVIGVVSHVPHFALLGYDNPDEGLDQELAALELGSAAAASGGGGATAHTSASPHDCEHGRNRAGQEDGGAAATAAAGAERLGDAAIRASHPPTSQVMRLHAILVRRSAPLVPPPPTSITTTTSAAVPTTTVAPSAPSTDNATEPAAPSTTATATTTTANDANALTAAPVPAPPRSPAPAGAGTVAPLRERALALLRLALGGDALAAEYVLLQLLSRAGRTSRGDAAALGQMALNLCKCPPGAPTAAADVPSSCCGHSAPALLSDRLGRGPGSLAAGLQAAISCLVPLSVALPVSLEAFNGAPWAPSRDPVRERTLPSPLQLAPGTVVVLDETVMAAGRFSDQGFKSFQALDALVRRQELVYDFETSQHPIPVDLPLIVLTEGRSLLREGVPIRLPLNATQPLPTVEAILAAAAAVAADISMTPADEQEPATTAAVAASSDSSAPHPRPPAVTDLAAVRSYLAAARLQEGYDLAEGMATTLEQYFVDARRAGGAGAEGEGAPTGAGAPGAAAGGGGMTPEEFHVKLTLARLLVQSHGEKQLTRQRWQQLLQLEHLREARLRVGA